MRRKIISFVMTIVLSLGLMTPSAFAHVVVKPNEVGVGERVNFAVSVPTEEDFPTVGVRLVVPDTMQSVRPNVKPGWNIELVKTGEGEEAKISEIIWTGGIIPVDQRDEFVFSAQAPTQKSDVSWKAYQTYSDGSVVSWDASPEKVKAYEEKNPQAGDDDANAPKPFSITKVVNDLEESMAGTESPDISGKNRESFQTLGTIAAIALAATSLVMVSREKN